MSGLADALVVLYDTKLGQSLQSLSLRLLAANPKFHDPALGLGDESESNLDSSFPHPGDEPHRRFEVKVF